LRARWKSAGNTTAGGATTDPFETLRAQLMQAAKRVVVEPVAPSQPGSRSWRRGRPRPLAVFVAALVICGSAATAVLSLAGRRCSHSAVGHTTFIP